MARRRTWLWIVVGAAGVGFIALIAVAGTGIYFVTHHIHSEHATGPDALRAFDGVIASFGSRQPLYELDESDEPRLVRPLASLPTSPTAPETLWMLAWDPEQDHLVRIALPLWLLRIGSRKMQLTHRGAGFSIERLKLDADELARVGPAIVLDYRNQDGVRVLLWTQ
jgi:hypothetical protein